MGKKSKLRRLGSSIKNRVKRTKQDMATVKHMISVGKKLRWTSEGIAAQIIERLPQQSKRYEEMTIEQKQQFHAIIFEECSKKPEYKAKELIGLARRIEKRVKKEIPN